MENKSFPEHSYIISGRYQDNIGSSSIEKNKSMIHGGSILKYNPGKAKLGILLAYTVKLTSHLSADRTMCTYTRVLNNTVLFQETASNL